MKKINTIEDAMVVKQQLEQVLFNTNEENVMEVLSMQVEDGSFPLFIEEGMWNDAYADFVKEPTYICSAILMKAYLEGYACMKEKEVYLQKALEVCSVYELTGHGYESFDTTLRALQQFLSAGVLRFLRLYPTMCKKFTNMIMYYRKQLKQALEEHAVGKSYVERVEKLLETMIEQYVFVYGSLMKGFYNHKKYLSDDNFVGYGKICGFDLYDLGSYPGIVDGNGVVYGEVYRVNQKCLLQLDELEAEGSLYQKREVLCHCDDGQDLRVFVYVYLRDVSAYKKLIGRYGDDYIWYVSYGSNMLEERLRYYIQGGICRYNNKEYTGCSNKQMPVDTQAVKIPYPVFFAQESNSWGGGVAFIDVNQVGTSYGRAYLLTQQQFEEIWQQEGQSLRWYGRKVELDAIDGIPAYTFTCGSKLDHRTFEEVSTSYLEVLVKGMKEVYPSMSEAEILAYFKGCK